MKRITACAAALFLFVQPAFAEDKSADAIAVAEHYLTAYSTFEPAKMAPYLADDMTFYDPTSTNQTASGGAFQFDGKAAVLKGLGDYAAQFNAFSVTYAVKRRYESAGVVVFIADLTYQGEGKDGQTFSGGAPIVTVITVKGGKVVQHTDYFDYVGNAVSFD